MCVCVCVYSLRYPFVAVEKQCVTHSECVSVALGFRFLHRNSNKYYIFSVCVCSIKYPFVAVEKQ